MKLQAAEARYQLTLSSYPSSKVIPQISQLLYQSEEPTLVASLADLPYVVGRRFSAEESLQLHRALKQMIVGHRLHPDLTGAPLYAFDPDSTELDISRLKPATDPSRKIIEFKLKKKIVIKPRWIFLATIVASLTTLIALNSQKESPKATPPAAATYEAKIERLERKVEYRTSQDLIWKQAEPQLSLFENDSLRTFQESSAELLYREGARLAVKPNTFLSIGKKSPNQKSLRLEDGKLQARLKASEVSQRLSIETPSGTLEMYSPKPGELKEAKIETSMDKGTLTVSVTQGSATLTPKAKEASPIELKSLEQVTATETSVSSPAKFEPTIDLISPAHDQEVVLNPQTATPTIFAWEPVDPASHYVLLLSTDPAMNEILLRQETDQPRLELSYLDLGNIYWQVVSNSEGVEYKSGIRRVHVQKSSD